MTFIQYLLPDGRQRITSIVVSEETERMAAELKAAGFRFECEVLRSGEVHMDCCDAEQQLANAVLPNGPGMREAVEQLVRQACEEHERITR